MGKSYEKALTSEYTPTISLSSLFFLSFFLAVFVLCSCLPSVQVVQREGAERPDRCCFDILSIHLQWRDEVWRRHRPPLVSGVARVAVKPPLEPSLFSGSVTQVMSPGRDIIQKCPPLLCDDVHVHMSSHLLSGTSPSISNVRLHRTVRPLVLCFFYGLRRVRVRGRGRVRGRVRARERD